MHILGDQIVDNRLCDSSKDQYGRRFNKFRRWVSEQYEEHADLNSFHIADEANIKVALEQLDLPVFKAFFADICRKRNADGELMQPVKYQSDQDVGAYRSALKFYYKKLEVSFPTNIDNFVSQFLGGYKRKIAELKQSGEMDITEGKMAITFDGYRYLARSSVRAKRDFNLAIFGHLSLLLCWNLLSRSVNVSSLMYDHMVGTYGTYGLEGTIQMELVLTDTSVQTVWPTRTSDQG